MMASRLRRKTIIFDPRFGISSVGRDFTTSPEKDALT
jgi:hypothetical protein